MTTWVPVSKLSIKVPSRVPETYSRCTPRSAASLAAPAGMLVNSSRPQPGAMTAYLLSIETLRLSPSKQSCTWCWPIATWRRHAPENDGRAKSSGSPYTRRSSPHGDQVLVAVSDIQYRDKAEQHAVRQKRSFRVVWWQRRRGVVEVRGQLRAVGAAVT